MVKLRPCLFAAGLLAIFLILPGGDPVHAQLFTGDQRSEIERIVKEYLLSHPELLRDVMTELDKRQTAAATEKHRAAVGEYSTAIFASPRQVTLGSPQGDVTLVEFFDYNCGYCKRAMSDMLELLKDDSSNSCLTSFRFWARVRCRQLKLQPLCGCKMRAAAKNTSSSIRNCWVAAGMLTRRVPLQLRRKLALTLPASKRTSRAMK